MQRNFYFHLLFLILATLLAWVWTQSGQLSFYSLQLTALLVLVYFVRQLWFSGSSSLAGIDGLIFSLVILLLVFTSGGSQSPLFFLLYFLLFGLAFAWEPWLTFAFSFFLAFFLWLTTPVSQGWQEWLNPLSLILVAPLSLYFGRQYLANLRQKRRLQLYQAKWARDEKHLAHQETAILLWLATAARPALIEMLDKLSVLLADLTHFTEEQRANLKRLRRLTQKLLQESQVLEKAVDQETDHED